MGSSLLSYAESIRRSQQRLDHSHHLMSVRRAAFSVYPPFGISLFTTRTGASRGISNFWTMTCDNTLNEYLRSLRPLISKAHIVLGNESADLDSIACSLALSFMKPHSTLPVLNLCRDDIRLRPDVILALRNSNIDISNLYFIDDTGVQEAMDNASAITLVDHNSLASRQSSLAPQVKGIIDHHSDECLFQHADPRMIVKTGSCATLVSEYIDHLSNNSSSGAAKRTSFSPACARLLLSAVLLDCLNMDERAGKTTTRDIEAAERLRSAAGLTVTQKDELFNSLYRARNDISGFSALELLRKDAKVVKVDGDNVVICSVPVSPDDLEARANKQLAHSVKQYGSERGLSAVVILLGYKRDGTYKRDIVVSADRLGDELASKLQNYSGAEILQLERLPRKLSGLHHFQQLNPKASRKAVLPIIKELMSLV